MSRISGPRRCIEGRLWEHRPQHDDPYLEVDVGECPECEGKGCVTCERCRVVMPDADCAEGCDDPLCAMRGT